MCPLAAPIQVRRQRRPSPANLSVMADEKSRDRDLAERPRHAAPFRLRCPMKLSPDRRRTHSRCYIPTAKSGVAPHRLPPQFPSPE
jgi:hypothetical protein